MKTSKGLGSKIAGAEKKSGLGAKMTPSFGAKKARGSGGQDKAGLANMMAKKK